MRGLMLSIERAVVLLSIFWRVHSFSLDGLYRKFSGDSAQVDTATEPQTFEGYPEDYGVDVSFPIHHNLKANTHFKKRYDDFIQGCYKAYSRSECDATEKARIAMNLDQPRSQWNYTEIGFKKLKAPQAAWEPLIKYYKENIDKYHPEKWPRGNTYTNNWISQTDFISLEDTSLRGGGVTGPVKMAIWNGVKPIIEEWVGKEVEATSLYGIRVYRDGAMLSTHVDRLPLVSSCIIQVAQDVDEPWPVEVYSHDGKAYNVTLEPGEMVLYESHTVLHGRPFPLKGRLYANVFVHFAPVDHDENNAKIGNTHSIKLQKKGSAKRKKQPVKRGEKIGGHEQDNHDPDEIDRHIRNYKKELEDFDEDGQTPLHKAASEGDVAVIEKLIRSAPESLNVGDKNKWQPLHEASRSGHLDAVKMLVDHGADLGSKTSNGATALWWARRSLPQGHGVIEYLESIGAPEEGDL